MRKYRYSVAFEFEATDDVEARRMAIHITNEHKLYHIAGKLQQVFPNKTPRKVSL